ncbi:hypothetical protein [Streptomyces sp. NPDC004685]
MMPGTIAEGRTTQVTTLPLVERRRDGEDFPRIPLGSMELTREQAATALFLENERLSVLPTDNDLLNALQYAVNTYGLSGLDAHLTELQSLRGYDRKVSCSYSYAYRLCVEHWYEDALAEFISPHLMACALYASDLTVTRYPDAHDRVNEIDGHFAEGVARLGAPAMMRLSAGIEAEFGRYPSPELPDGYRAAMPDRKRRKYCFDLAVNRQHCGPRALMVYLDDGDYAVGATPPEEPHGAPRRRRMDAAARARRDARKAARGGAA